jgi:hypothetical protein
MKTGFASKFSYLTGLQPGVSVATGGVRVEHWQKHFWQRANGHFDSNH